MSLYSFASFTRADANLKVLCNIPTMQETRNARFHLDLHMVMSFPVTHITPGHLLAVKQSI